MGYKEYFSNQAKKPSGLFGRLVMARLFDKGNSPLNDFMKEMLSLNVNDHILEIGFGTGKVIFEMAEIVNKGIIEGIDFSDTMTAIAKKRNKKYIAKGKVILKHGNFEETNYADNSFDKICSANTIYFWPQPDIYVKRIFRILKPGGKIVLAYEDKQGILEKPLSQDVFDLYTVEETEELLRESGFTAEVKTVSRKINKLLMHCTVAIKL